MSIKELQHPEPIGFYRLPQILQRIPVSKSTWWRWCAEGRAPAPCKIGERTTVWKIAAINQFIDELSKEGAGDE